MKTTILALGLALAASPILAGNLAFEPVAPEGLDAAAAEMVAALQGVMPDQVAAFEAQGFGAYGAILVPVGVALTQQTLAAVQGLADPEAAKAEGLKVCAAQFGTSCTVIGLLVPRN